MRLFLLLLGPSFQVNYSQGLSLEGEEGVSVLFMKG